jgi:hypothetical protein
MKCTPGNVRYHERAWNRQIMFCNLRALALAEQDAERHFDGKMIGGRQITVRHHCPGAECPLAQRDQAQKEIG